MIALGMAPGGGLEKGGTGVFSKEDTSVILSNYLTTFVNWSPEREFRGRSRRVFKLDSAEAVIRSILSIGCAMRGHSRRVSEALVEEGKGRE